MLTYTVRRLIFAVPTLLFIAFAIFLLLELAPGEPVCPLTMTAQNCIAWKDGMGVGQPMYVAFPKWLYQIFIVEPAVFIDWAVGTSLSEGQYRVLSWQFRSPVMDTIVQRLPQTLWVVGTAYVVAILIAIPVGVYSAYRQYSSFDNIGTFITMVGFSVPPFFSGVLVIVIFSVSMDPDSFWWFPSIYDTTHKVNDWESFMFQIRQMFMPVMVLALQITSQISRFMRASMLDNLNQDYVRTARAKGLGERPVVLRHVLRNSMIPVITVIALGIPSIFGGAIITEVVFKVNGIGQLLITAIQANDLPMVQTLTFIFAVLIVVFNLVADVLYGLLDPRIRYD